MRNQPCVKSQPATVRPAVEAVITAVAGRREPAILDSASTGERAGRFTIVACDPVCSLAWSAEGGDPFEGLRRRLRAIPCPNPGRSGVPQAENLFPGGWIGYFAYEAGRFIEKLPATTRPDVGLPVARWALYDTAAIHDAQTGQWTIVAADLSGLELGPSAEIPAEDRLADWAEMLQRSVNKEVTFFSAAGIPVHEDNMTQPVYERLVERALAYIAAGDIYQVNLARRESFTVREPAVTTYLRLRRTNPAAYAAFLQWEEPAGSPAAGEAAILCSSPELFLRLAPDGRVLTRPIKGTRPRSPAPAADEAYRLALATSPKDRAELAMIVDLERNDLGRVCEFGSIQAGKKVSGLLSQDGPEGTLHKRTLTPSALEAQPYVLESHPTVHHLVADVTGKLAENLDAIDLIRACFPGGSITGAPKVRAMEIIDELEPTERSVYTGAIGYISLAGTMELNIAIRTLILANGRLHLYTGGGIVADSRASDEYRETRAKALGMRRALGMDDA